jgi:hypothetical protein
VQVKGMSEAKIEKIKAVACVRIPMGFSTVSGVYL